MTKRIAFWLFLSFLVGTSAFAQVPNERARVEQYKRENPNTFACAHTPAPCGFNFIKVVACKLNPEPSTGPWGLNGKRGTSDLSWDALNYRGAGNGVDAFNGGPVQVIDVIARAGAPDASVTWIAFSDPQEASGRWIQPRCRGDVAIDANGNPLVPPGTPSPTPSPVPTPTCPPQKPCPPAPKPYPGDTPFVSVGTMIFSLYAEASQDVNAGGSIWFARTIWRHVNEGMPLDQSIEQTRKELRQALGLKP